MSFSEERMEYMRMIRESAAVFAPRGDLKRVREQRYQREGFSRAVWDEMFANGWLGIALPESMGGAGLGMAEYCALLEELGAALVPEPIVAAVMAARLSGDVNRVGEHYLLPAWQEKVDSIDGMAGQTRFRDGRVSGRKIFIPVAGGAGGFVVTTPEGPVVVDARAEGLQLQIQATQDGGHFGTLILDNVPAQLQAQQPADFETALDEAALGTAAYLLGTAEEAFRITLDYLQTRKQFGKAIGSFQALQHRAVDLKLQLALMRASVYSAAACCDGDHSPKQKRIAVSRAKARAAEAAMQVTREAIQLHGAIGYTDECDIGLFLRKAMTRASQYGSAGLHRKRYMALSPTLVARDAQAQQQGVPA